jgi:hypothetical protein
MNIHCAYCRHSYNLSRDYMIEVVNKAEESGQKYEAIECPSCRKTNKVSVSQMKRFLPKAAPAEASE